MPFLAGLLVGTVGALLTGGALLAFLLRKLRHREHRAAAAARAAELGMLTGGLAHEIKNPLSTLQLNLQLLREDLEARLEARLESPRAGNQPAEDAELKRMIRRLRTLNSETTRLSEILDHFLRYGGRLEVESQPIDLEALSEELVDFLAPQAQLARVRLEVVVDRPRVMALADAKLMKQALLNLLLNAIQHTPAEGSVTVRISNVRGPRGMPRQVQLDVVDTGPGIAPDEQARVFEPYFSRRKGGTGLGLATTRRIIEAHGGEIRLHNDPGGGARFTIVLPAVEGSAHPSQPAASAVQATVLAPALS